MEDAFRIAVADPTNKFAAVYLLVEELCPRTVECGVPFHSPSRDTGSHVSTIASSSAGTTTAYLLEQRRKQLA